MEHGTTAPRNVVVNEFPLFASSWVALFVLLRDNFARHHAGAAPISPKTGPGDHPH